MESAFLGPEPLASWMTSDRLITSLRLSILICKMGIITVLPHRAVVHIKHFISRDESKKLNKVKKITREKSLTPSILSFA